MIFGYARISTPQQSIDRQIRNISSYGNVKKIYQEAYTGTTQARPQWNELLKAVKAGDTIIFDSVSRMSRNAAEGIEEYMKLYNADINLIFLKEPHINTSTYRESISKQIEESISTGDEDNDFLIDGIRKLLNEYTIRIQRKQIRLAFEQAEKEVTDLQQRTKEGIETARRAGKRIGNVSGSRMLTLKSLEVKKLILKKHKYFGGGLNDTELIALCQTSGKQSVSRNIYYKYKAEIMEAVKEGKAASDMIKELDEQIAEHNRKYKRG